MLDGATFDAVLCDIMMSGISGFQVLKEVKRRNPQTVVIMISGLPLSPGVVESIEKEGAFGYVQKPFYEDHLKSTLRRALLLEEASLNYELAVRPDSSSPQSTLSETGSACVLAGKRPRMGVPKGLPFGAMLRTML